MNPRHTTLFALAALALVLPACQSGPLAPAPPASGYDVWTTPPPGADASAGRLVRQPAPTWTAPAPRVVTQARSKRLEVDGELGVFSKYVWRGQLLTDDPVLQPAATLSYGGWSFGVWANMDLGDVNDDEFQFTEVDLTLEYVHTIIDADPAVNLFAGVTGYLFPSSGADATAELYFGMGVSAPANPRFTLYYDVLEIEGLYATIDVHQDIPLPVGVLTVKAGLGWGDEHYNEGYWGVGGGAFNDFRISASWLLEAGGLGIKPSVAYTVVLDDDIADTLKRDDHVIFGLTLSRSF